MGAHEALPGEMPPAMDHAADAPLPADSASATLSLQVNGEPRACPAGLTLDQALAALGYRPQLVVVEFNGTIVPRRQWDQQPVQQGDVLEVVTIVGGGS